MRFDTRANFVLVTMNANLALTTYDQLPKRTSSLMPNEQDRRIGIADVVLQMMLNPPARTHPGRRHDDTRRIDAVDVLRLLNAAAERQSGKVQWRVTTVDSLPSFFVKPIAML